MNCPNCAKPAHERYRPFCSHRCADVDLGRWLTGGYAIAAEPADEDILSPEHWPETPLTRH